LSEEIGWENENREIQGIAGRLNFNDRRNISEMNFLWSLKTAKSMTRKKRSAVMGA
jgi:hypothetical protein